MGLLKKLAKKALKLANPVNAVKASVKAAKGATKLGAKALNPMGAINMIKNPKKALKNTAKDIKGATGVSGGAPVAGAVPAVPKMKIRKIF